MALITMSVAAEASSDHSGHQDNGRLSLGGGRTRYLQYEREYARESNDN